MNKISSLWRVGVLAAAVLGGSGGAYAATVFQEDFSAPIVFGDCQGGNRADNPLDPATPRALWREDSRTGKSKVGLDTISGGQLKISTDDIVGAGIVTKMDSRFDFLSPGQKRKFIVKGVKISGPNDDLARKKFRFLIASRECSGSLYPNFDMTVFAHGGFNVYVGKLSITGRPEPHALIDMDYSMPRAADQIELTLDNTSYELSFVFNVPANGPDATDPGYRPAYQGAFTFRGLHTMDAAAWGQTAGLPGYAASVGLFATAGYAGDPATNVTVDSFTVTDGAP